MGFNALYDSSNYVNPIRRRPSLRINGIDLRSFGLELLTLPNLLLPPTSSRNFIIDGVSGSIPLGDNYTDWNFSLDFDISANSYHELQKRKVSFYSWLHNQSNNFIGGIKSESIKGLFFEVVSNNTYYSTGTVSNSLSSKTVTGSSTKFLSYVSVGVCLQFSGSNTIYVVERVVSDTELELTAQVPLAHSSSEYRIERRKYLIVNYDGNSSASSKYQIGSLKSHSLNHTVPFSENINVGFYTNYPYWVGDEFIKEFEDIPSGASDYGSDDYGGAFLELEGVGNSTLRPTIVFEGEVKSPRLVDAYKSFSSNFEADTASRGIFNTEKKASVNSNYLYSSGLGVTGGGSILVTTTDTSVLEPNNWTYSTGLNNPYSEIGSIVNFYQGHLNVWLYPRFSTTNDRYILDTGIYNLNVYYDTSENRFKAELYNSVAYVDISITLNQWYNLQVSWDKSKTSDNLIIRVDNMIGYDTFSNTSSMLTNVGVGQDSNGGNAFQGYLDSFCIWDRVLDGTDIYMLQNASPSEKHQSQAIKFEIPNEQVLSGLVKPVSNIKRGWTHHINTATLINSSSKSYALNASEERIKTSPTKNREFQEGEDVIVYDETGLKTYGVVSQNLDGNIVWLRKDDFLSSQHSQLNLQERASLPNFDEVGSHCQFEGIENGKYFSGCNKTLPYGEKNPYMVISFWAKLDKDEALSYGMSGEDVAYLFHKIKGHENKYRGWGFAFDEYWNPRFVYHRLKSNADKVSKSVIYTDHNNRIQDGHGDWIIGGYQNNNNDFSLNNIRVNFDTSWSPSSYEEIKVKIIPEDDIRYAAVVFSKVIRETDDNFVFAPASPVYCKRGDNISITFDNTDSSNSSTYTTIITKEPDFTEKKTLSVSKNMNDDCWHHYMITIKSNNPSGYKYSDGRNYDEDVALSNYDVTMSIDGDINFFPLITDVDLAPKEDNPIIFGRNRIGMDDVGSGSELTTFPGSIKDFRVWSDAYTDFIGTSANIESKSRILAHDPCGRSIEWSTFQTEDAWYKFNDPIDSIHITDHKQNSGSDVSNLLPIGFTNYNASGLRGVKSFLSHNLIVDGLSLNKNLGGWIATNDYIYPFSYEDYLHSMSIVEESGSMNRKSIKITPNAVGNGGDGLTQFISTRHTGADGYAMNIDYNREYVFRCYSKRSTSTDNVVSLWTGYAEINSLEFYNNQEVTYSKQSDLSDYELQELSFSMNGSSVSHNSILVKLHCANTVIDSYFTGIEIYKNLIINGGFTYALGTTWSNISSGNIDRQNTNRHTGRHCLRLYNLAEARTSDVNVVDGLYYELSFWAKGSNSDTITLKFHDGNNTTNIVTESVSTTYKRYSVLWKSSLTTSVGSFTFSGNTSSQYIYLDDVVCLPREWIEHQRIDPDAVSSDLLYSAGSHSYAIDTTNDQSIYYNDIVGDRNSGSFSITFELEEDFNSSPSDNVIFSWFSDYSSSINYNDYIRLVRMISDTWRLESSRGGTLTTLCQGLHVPDKKMYIMGWWDGKGVFDDKDGLVYYAKIIINGYVIASSTTDTSNNLTNYNLKHLYLSSHGSSSSSSLYTRGKLEQMVLFPRSIPDNDLVSMYTRDSKMLNNSSGLHYNAYNSVNDILTYKTKDASSELYNPITYSKSSVNGDFSGSMSGLTVKDEKAKIYLKTSSDGSATSKMRIIYRPHFR